MKIFGFNGLLKTWQIQKDVRNTLDARADGWKALGDSELTGKLHGRD